MTINDAAEQAWVFSTFSTAGPNPRAIWIGLNDLGHEGNFTWISGEASSYVNWAPGEPNNAGPTGSESFVFRQARLTEVAVELAALLG